MQYCCKVWLESDDGFVIGEGTYQLLCAINEKGSLSDAARSLKISYAHAWRKLREIEKNLGTSVVEPKRGGKKGGSSILTKAGVDLLKEYEQLKIAVEKAIKTLINEKK
jgi:molybdate transport system regulatory protein